MTSPPLSGRLLIVDDDSFAREILVTRFEETRFDTETASGGEEAWSRLHEESLPAIDAVLLDWNMPGLSGIDLLRRLKDDADFQMVPVIFQSARNDPADLAEAIAAGAYYYLEKPIHPDMLVEVVGAALRDHRRYVELQAAVDEGLSAVDSLVRGEFEFRTVAEARNLASALSRACPNPDQTVVGLGELLVNAVEHGNLEITYEEKTVLLAEGRWEEEVARRQDLDAYRDRRVRVELERTSDQVRFHIRDEGPGFDWERFLDIRPDRLLDAHGRGIALARALCFSELEYRAPGNQVVAIVREDPDPN